MPQPSVQFYELQRSQHAIKILLVDGVEADSDTYTRYLQSAPDHNYHIIPVSTLQAAIATWQLQAPVVVILAVNLPDGEVLQFLEFLQVSTTETVFPAKVPVILLTEDGNERSTLAAMKLGAMDFLNKSDIQPLALQKSVAAVIEYQSLAHQLVRSQRQKELLSELALRIRQSLDLSQILQAAVDGLRQLLGCDRAIIYQFQPNWSGWILVESVSDTALSIRHREILDPCFATNWHEPYCQGRTSHVSDRDDGSLQPCYAELLASIQVRANLVTPILHNETLWGLMIAHECHQPRVWDTADIYLMQELATQMGIAIQQATAYCQLQIELMERQDAEAELQQLNQELEDRVAQRTSTLRQQKAQLSFQANILQEIHDAVVATNLDGIIETWNHGAERLFGYQATEVIGQSIGLLYDHPAELAAIIAPLLANEHHETEVACRAKSGELLYVHLRLSLSRDKHGNIVRLLGVSHDITAAKRSEAARQHVEAENRLLRERLQFILSSSPAVIYTSRAGDDFATTFVSDNVWSHFGYTPAEVVNQPGFWLNRVHPEDRPLIVSAIPRVLEQGHLSLEYRIQHQNGEYRWIQDEVRLVRSADGSPRELVGYVVDISDRHQIQTELHNLSDRLTLALDSAEIGTWDWDLENETIWDERMYTLYGLEELQHPITYQNWVKAIHPDDRDTVEWYFEQALVLGKFDTEFRIILPDGTTRFIKATGLMHYDHRQQPQRIVGINYDITARKQAEAALVRYTQEVEDLYNNAPCGYHSLDPQGRYLRVNETELQWLGYTRVEMIGKPIYKFLTEDSQQTFYQHYAAFLQQGVIKNVEYELIRKDGSILPVLVNATAVKDDDGNILYNRATLLDIRDRKQFEHQLQQTNAELARATRLKDEFLATMSHELRTPLNAILGLSETLQEQILGELNDPQQQAIATIASSGEHLLELINDILDLSKISSGKVELFLAPTSVQALCEASLLFIKQQALQKQLHVTSDIPTSLGNIVVDERRMRQVLINLLMNAVKFTPNGGQISLNVAVGCGDTWQGQATVPESYKQQHTPLLLLQVSDTGVGIAPQDITRLFQPFVQIDSSLNRQQPGTGLGLVMVKQIAKLHGGDVTVTSHPGRGSCFTVALPARLAEIAASSTPVASEPVSPAVPIDTTKTAIAPLVLLAEDNEDNVATFSAYLTARNYRVMVAANGEEAVSLASSIQPDIILMDIQMPTMDGLTATQLLRANESCKTIPIIALTALAMPGDEARCRAAGANHYLSKPISLKQLVQDIQALLPVHTP